MNTKRPLHFNFSVQRDLEGLYSFFFCPRSFTNETLVKRNLAWVDLFLSNFVHTFFFHFELRFFYIKCRLQCGLSKISNRPTILSPKFIFCVILYSKKKKNEVAPSTLYKQLIKKRFHIQNSTIENLQTLPQIVFNTRPMKILDNKN